MSEQRVIAQTSSIVQKVAPATYWWCTCKHSSKMPFYDGTHSRL